MVFLSKLSYFFSRNHRKFEFFKIARAISKSGFFAIFCKRQGKLLYEVVTGKHLTEISTYQQHLPRLSFQQYFSSLVVNCLLFPACTIWLRQNCSSNEINLRRNEKLPIFRSSCSFQMFSKIDALKNFAKLFFESLF